MYDVTTSRDHNNAAKVTTFHLPKDTTKVIHITRLVNKNSYKIMMITFIIIYKITIIIIIIIISTDTLSQKLSFFSF